jgi:hypothetical protein
VQIRATASDEDGSYLLDPLPVVVLPQPLQVESLSSDRNGFAVRFNDAFNASVINLYDSSLVGRGVADVVLIGSSTGLVKGSLVFDADYRGLRYQVSGNGLARDSYSVTLKSGAQAFHSIWSALDGNADGLAGDDYRSSFSVAAPPSIAALAARLHAWAGAGRGCPGGEQQTAAEPAQRRRRAATELSSFATTRTLLLISSSEAGADLPADATLDFSGSQPGELRVRISSPTAIAAGTVTLVDLVASVPASAPYGASQILDIDEVSVNGQAVSGADDDALHVVGYLGDSDGNSRTRSRRHAADSAHRAEHRQRFCRLVGGRSAARGRRRSRRPHQRPRCFASRSGHDPPRPRSDAALIPRHTAQRAGGLRATAGVAGAGQHRAELAADRLRRQFCRLHCRQ